MANVEKQHKCSDVQSVKPCFIVVLHVNDKIGLSLKRLIGKLKMGWERESASMMVRKEWNRSEVTNLERTRFLMVS